MALTKIDDRGLKTPIDLLDNEKIRFGTGNDLDIFHDSGSTKSMINNQNGELRIVCDNAIRIGKRHDATIAYADNMIVANPDGSVELYYNNSLKFETTSIGVQTSGYLYLTEDGKEIRMGAGGDLRLWHNGTDSYIHNAGANAGNFYIRGAGADVDKWLILQAKSGEDSIVCKRDAEVYLAYDGVKKLETETTGAKVTGMLGVNVTPDTSASSTYALQLKGSTQCYLSIANDTTGTGISNGLILGNDANDVYIYNRENTPMNFGVNDTTKFIMKTGGQFQIIDGDLQLASGHGIDFSATGDASGQTSELLDDYEEGSWSPNFYGTSGNDSWTNGCTGSYTKIGNKVTVRWSAQNYSGDLSGSLAISGLPYSNDFRQYGGDFGIYNINAPSDTIGKMMYFPTGSVMYIYWEKDNDGGPQMQGSELKTGSYIEGNFTYRTA